jgi:hypothetical protein
LVVGVWTPNDLRMMLDHQLATDIAADTGTLAANAPNCACTRYCEFFPCNLGGCSELASRVKEHFKQLIHSDSDFPKDIAKFFYLMAILRAKRAGIHGVSTMTKENMKRQVSHMLTLGWLSGQSRSMLRDCSAFLFVD